jgi:hypothetical protein
VIQRADVVKKAVRLGFPDLTENSSPATLGAAIIQHWNEKISTDRLTQGVSKSYEGILLKNIKGTQYIYCEYQLNPLDPNIFSWSWSVNKKTGKEGLGLQGSIAGQAALVWYKNQKQLFKVQSIPVQAVRINIKRNRLTLDKYVETVLKSLQEQFNIDLKSLEENNNVEE